MLTSTPHCSIFQLEALDEGANIPLTIFRTTLAGPSIANEAVPKITGEAERQQTQRQGCSGRSLSGATPSRHAQCGFLASNDTNTGRPKDFLAVPSQEVGPNSFESCQTTVNGASWKRPGQPQNNALHVNTRRSREHLFSTESGDLHKIRSACASASKLFPFVPHRMRKEMIESMLEAPQNTESWRLQKSTDVDKVKPNMSTFYGVVMVVDIAGFTKLTEMLSSAGIGAVELLTKCINNLFSTVIDLISRYGVPISHKKSKTIVVIHTLLYSFSLSSKLQ